MEQRSTDLCVIFAGYKDRMDQFFSYIPGMQSRVNLHIVRGLGAWWHMPAWMHGWMG